MYLPIPSVSFFLFLSLHKTLYYQFHSFHFAFVFRSACNNIYTCSVYTAVAKNIGEPCYILFKSVKYTGKQVAKIMFFNGLSRTKTNGDLTSLPNPYIQDNLSFSFQMQMASESLYPTLARRIYLKGYRYNLHLMPKSLLIEAGAQTNSVEEVKNAMDLLAILLGEVLL